MTTSNKIIISQKDSVIYIPLECLHSKNDSITYVYKKEGLSVKKQEVEIGENNMNDVIILKGVSAADRLYLSIPDGYEDAEISLLPELNGKRNIKKQEPVEDKPKEKTITLPDGRVITVPADGQGRGKGMWNRKGDKNDSPKVKADSTGK